MTSSRNLREWSRLQARRGMLQTTTDAREQISTALYTTNLALIAEGVHKSPKNTKFGHNGVLSSVSRSAMATVYTR